MLGYAGGFVGQLMVGVVLGLRRHVARRLDHRRAAIAGLMALALVGLHDHAPRDLAGDRATTPDTAPPSRA
ncbi:MAG: hypothetical protein R3D67_08660 [Hyphomicrobiaceae bacterium]